MPRAYIRVCLAYKVPNQARQKDALRNLSEFVRKVVDAKPYLSGYLVPALDPHGRRGRAEIRFSDEDFLSYCPLQERYYSDTEMPFSYDQLDRSRLPPSVIRPDLVSALSEGADDDRAPLLRVQANILRGGLIVSFYLHHCISDGTGLGLLISGAVLNDEYTFDRYLCLEDRPTPGLTERLNFYAKHKSIVREALSWCHFNELSPRDLRSWYFSENTHIVPTAPSAGRGCIFEMPCESLRKLQDALKKTTGATISLHDTIGALLWHSMTRAREPSLEVDSGTKSSKLLVPINIRTRLDHELASNYFGAAVDFVSIETGLMHLRRSDTFALAITALKIRRAIKAINETYIRKCIELANADNPDIDVRDLQAANMNRITGADMYITSWWRQPLYDCELGMGLGKPDWVRKPWSKDPGSCIILPQDDRKSIMEVVVQMTEVDMARLLEDTGFKEYWARVIE